MSAAADRDDLEEIRAGLRADAENVALALMGEPDRKDRNEWRWGKGNGSEALVLRGSRRGLWNDRASGGTIGGDLFSLIQHRRHCSFAQAVEWARAYLAMPQPERPKAKPRPSREAEQRQAEAEDAARLRRARAFASAGEPIAGTVAERYLIDARRIPRPASGWPDGVRFHRGRNALLMVATNDAGEVRAVQLVHLTVDAVKRGEEPGRPVKQTFGILEGSVVRLSSFATLSATAQPALQLAEGPETGLSVWASTGRPTWIALGSIAKVQPPALARLVVCADDDPRDTPAAKAVQKAVARWRGEARDVAVATPWSRRRFDKSDFNDLIRRDGPAAVVARIDLALSPRGPQPPGNAALPIDLARLRLAKAMEAFFAEARDYDLEDELLGGVAQIPPVHALRIGVGGGKSDLARRMTAKMLAAMRKRGDRRNIAFAVPTHALGEEQARKFEELEEARDAGLRAAVWRGRDAEDPRQPGSRMCHDLAAVHEAQSIGAKPEVAVCRNRRKPDAPACPFFEECGYQRQKAQVADLWFIPHELLFAEKPAALGKIAVLVVDEAAWRKGLEGVDGPPIDMTLDTLAEDVATHRTFSRLNVDRLRSIHQLTHHALMQHPDGPLRREALLGAGLNNDTGRDGYALSWERVIEADIQPGMPAEDRRDAVRAVLQNKTAMRCARFFGTLRALLAEDGPEASGWASLVTIEGEKGPIRVVRLRGRRSVGKAWLVPTIHIDATLNVDLLRPYWPTVQMTAEIDVRAPHMRIRQLHGRDWPKTALVPDDYCKHDKQEGERRLKNSERVRAVVWREARATNGRVLVVVQKAVEDYWRQAGPIPGNVELAHHNNVAGRDEWGPQPGKPGVDLTIIVGRTQPRPGDVERIAEALTGKAVSTRCSRYDRQDAAIQIADGTAMSAHADRHPDPLAEAIRWQICEGELIQIIGRPRGVMRTSANPTEVLLLTDRPLPIPIDEVVGWDALAPTPVDLMMGQGGVAFDDAADASRAYPNLWPDRRDPEGKRGSPEASKKAFQRARCGTNPNREYSIGECPAPLRRAAYQRAGAGKRPASVTFDPAAVPEDELRDWLEERVGLLAWLKVEPPPPPLPEPPKPAPEPDPDDLDTSHDGLPPGQPRPWPAGPMVFRPPDVGSDPLKHPIAPPPRGA